ncbi:uncharacterized protein [Phaseolus vulgaris]|uniref:uncharacterized protein n=1 Tax=Phaseolus vulgaris TaxID=3885 RepID=UPI0035CB73D1
MKRSKAKTCLFVAVSPMVFPRIMFLRSAKEIWDYLKVECAGDERIRGMQVLNLIREFELQIMKESESVKEYSDILLSIVNKVRLFGFVLNDSRIVEKPFVTVRKRFEATITILDNTKDLSKISLAELLNSQQPSITAGIKRKRFTLPTCHPPFKCWRIPDAKCFKCNQLGHEAMLCKNKNQVEEADDQVTDQEEEDQLFVATCFSSRESSESWLVDSGCTNHMTHDKELFKELRTTEIKWVRIGNGEHLTVKGKGTVAITNYKGTKIITNVLFVPEIDQNLLSVSQLLEKGYKVMFENKHCLIKDVDGRDLFKVEMKGKSFALNPMRRSTWPLKKVSLKFGTKD